MPRACYEIGLRLHWLWKRLPERNMKKPHWSKRAVIKYTLLQIPGVFLVILVLILARRWWEYPIWLAWVTLIVWIAKDIVLFPFVWRSYDTHRPGDPHSMIGMRGKAEERLAPSGYVRVRGELWLAEVVRGGEPIEKGQKLRVKEMNGLTLIVIPESDE